MTDATQRLIDAPPCSIRVRSEEHATIVVLAGELDASRSHELDTTVKAVFRHARVPVIVDLRELRFLDSSGLRVLLVLRNDARRTGREFALIPGGHAVQRIFELTGTRGAFEWSFGDGTGTS